MKLHIGIEAIGLRQTIAVLADERGAVIYAFRTLGMPILLHSTDRVLVRKRLTDLLRELLAGAGCGLDDLSQASLAIGIGGAAFPSELHDLKLEFNKLEYDIPTVHCTRDVDIVLASHVQSNVGGAIMCGSGAATLSSNGVDSHRVGGWGPAIGDTGSGYWIGRQAITSISKEDNSEVEPSGLWESVRDWLVSPAAADDYPDLELMIVRWKQYSNEMLSDGDAFDPRGLFLAFLNRTAIEFHREWRCFVANLARPVAAAAHAGDLESERLLADAMERMCAQYIEASRVIPIGNRTKHQIALYGGFLNHNTDWRNHLGTLLRDHFGGGVTLLTQDTLGTLRPALGSLLLSYADQRKNCITLPPREILETMTTTVSGNGRLLEALQND